ncbi:Probable global transcription activator SNF2L1 (ATP-dependent helicase SMARCA1) (DNA-dependent ATPase SNF2L) (Nucleosome-remodeling factor subunit SNF2L) (SWI/SNF-related matrix-associated actin-dependent regulator of chromatin subfamily A member 1) [Durusdinium trenchii]|uniref:Uncharacterized protein n=1 Tax=Durusdinium trenchii TaxID=1381693 RepID=A0ABP0I8P9_9DINO
MTMNLDDSDDDVAVVGVVPGDAGKLTLKERVDVAQLQASESASSTAAGGKDATEKKANIAQEVVLLDGDDDGEFENIPIALMRPRRSNKERTINVNGISVLKENNYRLKGGKYQFNVMTATSKRPKQTPTPAKKAKKPKTGVSLSSTSSALENKQNRSRAAGEFKAKIAAGRPTRIAARNAFLAANLDKLAPFITESVKARLRQTKDPSAKAPGLRVDVQPDLVEGGTMRDYQLDGLAWMAEMHARGCPMILGDEMGLGKTLQTIALLCHLKETKGGKAPSLVVCPLSVLSSWMNEFKHWAPSFKVLQLHSSDVSEREIQRRSFEENPLSFDAVVTTYEMVKNPTLKQMFAVHAFRYVVLDEGHIIKNEKSQISQALRRLHFESTLLLTGTPLQNNLRELWALLNYMLPDIFGASPHLFENAFNITENKIDNDMLDKAHFLLKVFMKRRLKSTVEKMMPAKVEVKVLCPLSACQIFWYKGLLLKDLEHLAQAEKGGAVSRFKVLSNLVMQLRKICNHPFVFPEAEGDPTQTSLEDLVAASGKLAVLDGLLVELLRKGHRVVLFSQFTRTLDLIEDYLWLRKIPFLRFDGASSRVQRKVLINRFNAFGDENVFIMSTRAGGMGINLQTADTCVLFDSDWNPQPDLQAMARVHRIGQKKTVHIYRLLSAGTIEERILERAEKKLYLDSMVNIGGRTSSQDLLEKLGADELLKSLKFGSDAVFGAGPQHLPTPDEIRRLIDRTKDPNQPASRTAADLQSKPKSDGGGEKKSDAEFDPSKDLRGTKQLCGVDFTKAIEEKKRMAKKMHGSKLALDADSLASSWQLVQGKRKRVNRIQLVEGKGSGYGQAFVPVLKANNYSLEAGEQSVFARELRAQAENATAGKSKSKKAPAWKHQDMCQACGGGFDDTRDRLCCNKCPVAMHVDCDESRVANPKLRKNLVWSCTQHSCALCQRSTSVAGGVLFVCQACPNAFCEECLPPTARIIGPSLVLEKLGFESKVSRCTTNCSQHCEQVAKVDLGWVPAAKRSKAVALELKPLDVSHAFGTHTSAILEQGLQAADEEAHQENQRRQQQASAGIRRKRVAAPPVKFVPNAPGMWGRKSSTSEPEAEEEEVGAAGSGAGARLGERGWRAATEGMRATVGSEDDLTNAGAGAGLACATAATEGEPSEGAAGSPRRNKGSLLRTKSAKSLKLMRRVSESIEPPRNVSRFCIIEDERPGVLSEVTTKLGEFGLNIVGNTCKVRGQILFQVVDLEVDDEDLAHVCQVIKSIEGVRQCSIGAFSADSDTLIKESGPIRLCIVNQNVPGVLGHVSSLLEVTLGLRVISQVNRSRGDTAYNVFDLEHDKRADWDAVCRRVQNVEHVISCSQGKFKAGQMYIGSPVRDRGASDVSTGSEDDEERYRALFGGDSEAEDRHSNSGALGLEERAQVAGDLINGITVIEGTKDDGELASFAAEDEASVQSSPEACAKVLRATSSDPEIEIEAPPPAVPSIWPVRPRSSIGISGGRDRDYYDGSKDTKRSRRLTLMNERSVLTADASKLVVVMVGLPARGKSFTARKIRRFLCWRNFNARIFNAGKYRRERGMSDGLHEQQHEPTPADAAELFESENSEGLRIRQEAANRALGDLVEFLDNEQGAAVGIFDATNSTESRRSWILQQCKHIASVVFIEVICDDEEVLMENLLSKVRNSPDFEGMDEEKAITDLRTRIRNYEKVYEAVSNEAASYIKIYNMSSKILANKIYGRLARSLLPYMLSLHVGLRPVWFVRAGLAEDAENDGPTAQLGSRDADFDFVNPSTISKGSRLSAKGLEFAERLSKWIQTAVWVREEDEGEVGDNTIDAAFQATPKGGLHTRLGSFQGPIAESDASRLFDPYKNQKPEVRKTDGTRQRGAHLKVLCSTLPRSEHTAQVALSKLERGTVAELCPMLNPLDKGEFAGLSMDQIEVRDPEFHKVWSKSPYHTRFPGGESYYDVVTRLEPVLVEMEQQTAPVLIVSHVSCIQVLLAYFLGCPVEEAMTIKVPLHKVIEVTPTLGGSWEINEFAV